MKSALSVSARNTLANNRAYWLILVPAIVLMAVFYFLPLVLVLRISVTEPQLGFGNYAFLLTSGAVHRVLLTTARICIITTCLAVVFGYAVAYVLVHSSASMQRWMIFGVLLPLWISVLARAFAWVTLLRREGLINEFLLSLGLISEPLSLVWNEFGIIVGMVHYMLPYAILPLYANMREIDARVVAAARGLGATRWQAFWQIFLPLSLPGIVGAGVLVFIVTLGFYVTPAILGGGRTLMIAEFIGIQIQTLLRWGLGAMMATVLLIAVLATLAVLSRVVDFRKLFGVR